MDRVHEFALLRVERGVLQQLGHAEDAVHRRADLVAHVGQELALGPAGGLGALPGLEQRGLSPSAVDELLRTGDAIAGRLERAG